MRVSQIVSEEEKSVLFAEFVEAGEVDRSDGKVVLVSSQD